MAKTRTERYGARPAGWLGIVIATTVTGPAAYRLAERGFSFPDVLPAVAGAVLPVFRAVRLVRRRATPGSGKVHEPGIV